MNKLPYQLTCILWTSSLCSRKVVSITALVMDFTLLIKSRPLIFCSIFKLMSVITVVIPPPIICIQTEQEFSGTSLPQLPAIIWNDCIHENNPFPHWFTLRLSLSHFLSGTHAYTLCFGISRSFLQIKSKLLPYFTTTSSYKPPQVLLQP